MSVTTTDNPLTTTIRQDYLHDYNIHLSGGDHETSLAPPNRDNARPPVENPPDWYNEHREVPPYRPVNTHLSREERPWGSNPVESAFVFHMLHGVWLTAAVSWAWRNTGGKLNDHYFRYKVGGEI